MTPLRLRLTPGSIQLPTPTRESTELHEELESTSLCTPSLETSSVQTSRRFPYRVLAGVTAGAAVSTYGVEMLPRLRC
jgi:hypothetical protein